MPLSDHLVRMGPLLPAFATAPLLRRRQRSDAVPEDLGGRVQAEERSGVRVLWLDRDRAARGTLVYLPGGAYVSGPTEDRWRWLAETCSRAGMAGALVHYGMPPEHVFPAALDDALAAVAALQDDGVLGPGTWCLAGDSAGGGLAIAAVSRLASRDRTLPAGLLLTAPWVDLTLDHPEIDARLRSTSGRQRAWFRWAARQYAAGRSLTDPQLSPVHGTLDGLPATHINVGTSDLFVHDVRLLRDRLLGTGTRVEYLEEPGAPHTYPHQVASARAQRTIASQAAWLVARLDED